MTDEMLVLIVDDDATNRKLLRDVLQFQGYATAEAATGAEGVRLAQEIAPTLVLLDVQLPDMNGSQVLALIQTDSRLNQIPVVALTGFAMRGDAERLLRQGFTAYVAKPIDIGALIACVQELSLAVTGGAATPQAKTFELSISGPPSGGSSRGLEPIEVETMPLPGQFEEYGGDVAPTLLLVDDTALNLKLLEALLFADGYRLVTAASGEEALRLAALHHPDLVLLDIVMPGIDGLSVCRQLRADPETRLTPIIMVTASSEQQKIDSIEAGADDFVAKPLNAAELQARVRSLLRIRGYYNTMQRQARELARWSEELEARVEDQVVELERMGRLRRFLSPQVAELVLSAGDQQVLDSHRREIAVVFCDLRGFTAFAETSEPEDIMGVLRDYHEAMGRVIFDHGGTLERFTGDGLMVFFNDPVPCTNPSLSAVTMAVAMRERARELNESWRKRDYDLGFGVGVAFGYATLGRIGFEGRSDYAAIGTVTNLAARLCDEAAPSQILVSHRVASATEEVALLEKIGDLTLKGFQRPVPAYNVVALRET